MAWDLPNYVTRYSLLEKQIIFKPVSCYVFIFKCTNSKLFGAVKGVSNTSQIILLSCLLDVRGALYFLLKVLAPNAQTGLPAQSLAFPCVSSASRFMSFYPLHLKVRQASI